jgi:hypothetical protein
MGFPPFFPYGANFQMKLVASEKWWAGFPLYLFLPQGPKVPAKGKGCRSNP